MGLARFDHVTLKGAGTARIAIGEPQLLQFTADHNLFALLAIGVKDGALTIRAVKEVRPGGLLVTVRVPDLRGAEAHRSRSRVRRADEVKGPKRRSRAVRAEGSLA